MSKVDADDFTDAWHRVGTAPNGEPMLMFSVNGNGERLGPFVAVELEDYLEWWQKMS
jgi:hypothetical protein